MDVVRLEGILGVVLLDESNNCAFEAASWVGRGYRKIEVEVHCFLVGPGYNFSSFDGKR